MTIEEIFQQVDETCPDLLEKTATAVDLLERLDPEEAAEVAREMLAISEYTGTKVASIGRDIATGVAVTAGSNLAVSLMTDMFDAAKRGLTRGIHLRRIMKHDPDLANSYSQRDLRNAFNTVHRYAPDYTADPVMGAQLVGALAAFPANASNLIPTLVQSRKNLTETKYKQFGGGNRPVVELGMTQKQLREHDGKASRTHKEELQRQRQVMRDEFLIDKRRAVEDAREQGFFEGVMGRKAR